MSASFAIKSLLKRMPLGQIFTTRDLIGLGSRPSIDNCIYRLVKKGLISRIARGVFCKGDQIPILTPLELARIKAHAFNKEVYEHETTTAQRLGYVATEQSQRKESRIFATNGTGSTSFMSVIGLIQLKPASARKRPQHKNEVWELLKSLWCLGKGGTTSRIQKRITEVWGRKSQESLQTFCASVPQWLLEQFPYNLENAIKAVAQTLIPSQSDLAKQQECWCPDRDHCVCPMYTCQRCQDQPIRNRFSIALG